MLAQVVVAQIRLHRLRVLAPHVNGRNGIRIPTGDRERGIGCDALLAPFQREREQSGIDRDVVLPRILSLTRAEWKVPEAGLRYRFIGAYCGYEM